VTHATAQQLRVRGLIDRASTRAHSGCRGATLLKSPIKNRMVEIEARMADPAAYAETQVDEWHNRLKAGGERAAVAQRAGFDRLVLE
jgi:hypothetical protein